MRVNALDDVKVVDLAAYIAGAYASGLLADLGAQVDKIESFEGDAFRGIVAGFQSWNRGKRGIVLNLRTQEGREVLYRMVERADVVVENYRHGVAQRLGADYETLRAINPRIIYCTVTAYGTRGPNAGVPGFDPLFQSLSGAMEYQGGANRPPSFLRIAISDYSAAIMAAWGVCMALYHRARTGQGQRVETALMNSVVAVQAGEFLFRNKEPWNSTRVGTFGIDATHRLYKASDAWLYLACDTPTQWKQLCIAIDHPELVSLWETVTSKEEIAITNSLTTILPERSADVWIQLLAQSKFNPLTSEQVKLTGLRTSQEFSRDPRHLEQGLIIDVDSPEYGPLKESGPPFTFSETPGIVRRSAPMLGQHTAEILSELGYTKDQISALKDVQAIP
ncbi:MAG: CoA transferase [Chloroflexota bacterium]|nr:CoA transferase [Chloroflexota bacterium]